MHGRPEKCIEAFGIKIEGKRTLGISKRRFEGNIKINVR
jgi:hypothetical protein